MFAYNCLSWTKKYWNLSVNRCFIFNPSAWWELDLLLQSDQNHAPEVSHLAYKINLLVEFLNKRNYIPNKIMSPAVNRTHSFMTRFRYAYRCTANGHMLSAVVSVPNKSSRSQFLLILLTYVIALKLDVLLPWLRWEWFFRMAVF